MPKPTITTATTRKLRAMASKHFPKDDYYRAWLAQQFDGVRWSDPDRPSTLDLTERQGRRAIALLASTGKPHMASLRSEPTPRPSHEGRYDGGGTKGFEHRLTQGQADEIARLEDVLGWTNDPARLAGFIQYQLAKKKKVSKLTLSEATKVITGLRVLSTGPART